MLELEGDLELKIKSSDGWTCGGMSLSTGQVIRQNKKRAG